MQTLARSMADTGPMGGRYMPHAPPIVGRYGKRPHSRMRRLQLRTVHNLISSPRAFAARAAPKEPLVDSADVPAPRISGDQLGSLRSARKKSRGAPPVVAARLPVEPPQKNPLDKLGLPRRVCKAWARVPAGIANARARSVAAPIANREQQKSTAEGRKCGQLFSVEREGSRFRSGADDRRRRAIGICSQTSDVDHTHRIRVRRRSGQQWPGREL